MDRAFRRSCVALSGLVVVLALGLSGCGAGSVTDNLPQGLGGLPQGAPERPATPYQYPAVHDMPPPRPAPTMSEDEVQRLENELKAARDRQEGRAPPQAAKRTGKKTTPETKSQPSAANDGRNTGAGGNP